MTKFSGSTRRRLRANVTAPVRTRADNRRVATHEGGVGYEHDDASALFLLAATNMVGEDTFYERAPDRDARFVDLVHRVTATDPAFIAGNDPAAGRVGLVQYLRQSMLMRSAAVVMAAEYVAAGGAGGRSVIERALQRPDEPAEMVGYWMATHGRRLPMAVKRGVADAARRMYNERATLRYDGLSRQTRMADVIELVHPEPQDAAQSALFRYLLDRRHHDDAVANGVMLPMLAAAGALDAVRHRRASGGAGSARPAALAAAGYSWERLAGWLPGGMDAEAWEAVIPSMGVMALVRNLRNFDEAAISEASVELVIAKITDPVEVAKARLFPYQVWAAYTHAPSDDWKRALAKTLAFTTRNIPALDGTLVVIDTSASMQGPVSARSTMGRVEVAAVMAMATAPRRRDVDVVIYGQTHAKVRGLGGHVGAGRGGQGGARGGLGGSRTPSGIPPLPIASTRHGTSGSCCSPTTSSRIRVGCGSITCRSSTRSTSPATGPRRCRRAVGVATPWADSPTPRSPPWRCSRRDVTRSGRSELRAPDAFTPAVAVLRVPPPGGRPASRRSSRHRLRPDGSGSR